MKREHNQFRRLTTTYIIGPKKQLTADLNLFVKNKKKWILMRRTTKTTYVVPIFKYVRCISSNSLVFDILKVSDKRYCLSCNDIPIYLPII